MANVIFDFDGTIADSLSVAISIFEELMRDGKALLPDEIERLRAMSMVEVALELRITPWKVPFLLARGRKMMRQRMDTVEAFDGMPELIRQLHEDGHRLYIMSSNSVHNITPLLERYNLHKQFIKLYGSAGVFGKDNVLRRMLKRQKLNPAETYYVGDEVRDIEAAKKAGIPIISVEWGYNSAEILRKHKPDFFVTKPKEIARAITKA